MHVVNKDYNQKKQDELTIKKGDFVYVLEKSFNGWWKIRFKINKKDFLIIKIYLILVPLKKKC